MSSRPMVQLMGMRLTPASLMKASVCLIAAELQAFDKEAAAQGSWTGNASLTSDYTWRGVSSSNGDPAIQGGFDYANGALYAGVWASTIDFGDASDANLEVSYYAGLADILANRVSWDLRATFFTYPGTDGSGPEGLEISAGLGYSFENGLWIGTDGAFSPGEDYVYASLKAGYALNPSLSMDASLGSYRSDTDGDYADWSVGATASRAGVSLDLRYWDTDIENFAPADERIVLTVSISG